MAKRNTIRLLAVVAAAGMVAAACSGSGNDGRGDQDGDGGAVNTRPFPYQTALFEDLKYDNYWAYMADPTVWNAYVLAPAKCGLYDVVAPNNANVPEVAAAGWEPATQEGDNWVVEVPIHKGLKWSDGEPLTAEDFVFTFETVRDLQLGGNWVDAWKPVEQDSEELGVVSVEAPNPTTVRIAFNQQPGLTVWPNSVGLAPVVAEHFWADKVAAAKKSDDPTRTFLAESGKGDPSCGPVVFDNWQKGSHAQTKPNPNWHLAGTTYTHYEDGAVRMVNEKLGIDEVFGGEGGGKVVTEYTVGPYLENQTYSIYKEQSTAVLALRNAEADFLYNSLGMQRGLQDQVLNDPELSVVSNPTNGFRYLAFNFRREPMKDRAFRQAIATMIDREFIAENILGGVPQPLFTTTPPGNERWFNEKVADEISKPYRDMDQWERLEKAVKILKDAGYSWEREPRVRRVDGEPEEIVPGSRIRMPNGEPMREIELVFPGASYDPLRSTFGIQIEAQAQKLGIPVNGRETGFNVLSDKVDPAGDLDFDMYILGWSLGNPAAPDHYDAFFTTDGAQNSPGYSNPEYDKAVDRYIRAQTEEEAYQILWEEIEPTLARDLPYVVLFDTPLAEFYRSASVKYPYTDTFGGLAFQNGLPDSVSAAQ